MDARDVPHDLVGVVELVDDLVVGEIGQIGVVIRVIGQLVAVGETPEIPEAGICARPGLSPASVQSLKRALLAIKRPEYAAQLKGIYDIDGFVEGRDADYDPVRDALTLMDYRPAK